MKSLWNNRDFGPMLLEEIKEPFDSDDYIFEIKFDGFRALIFASPKEVKIQSRNIHDITYLYPELQSIKKMVKENVIFDGEIIVTDAGVPSFSLLQQRSHLKKKKSIDLASNNNPVTFIAFDILYQNKDLTELPLVERKKYLNKYHDTEYFVKSKVIENKGINLFKEIKKLNLEGIVAKKKKGLYYINSRTDEFIKIKNIQRDEFYIGGYIEKENTLSILLGEYKDNKLYYVGKVSVGKRQDIALKLIKMKKEKNSFCNLEEEANYVKPSLTCFVEYLERTKSGHLRHPVFKNYSLR